MIREYKIWFEQSLAMSISENLLYLKSISVYKFLLFYRSWGMCTVAYAGGGDTGDMSQSPTTDERGKNREKETKNKLKRKKNTCCPRVSGQRWVRHCMCMYGRGQSTIEGYEFGINVHKKYNVYAKHIRTWIFTHKIAIKILSSSSFFCRVLDALSDANEALKLDPAYDPAIRLKTIVLNMMNRKDEAEKFLDDLPGTSAGNDNLVKEV